MIEFDSLSVRDFLSVGEVLLPIGDSGVTLVTGRGQGALPSNGAGKSSLLESLVWAIYGRTVRELQYDDDVVRRGAKTAEVAVALRADGREYRVVRTKPRGEAARLSVLDVTDILDPTESDGVEMFVGSVVERTKALAGLLRCDFETFCNTCYFPQGRFAFFSQATDAQRKAVFDQVLGTAYFQEVERAAKTIRGERAAAEQSALAAADLVAVAADAKSEELDRAEKVLAVEEQRAAGAISEADLACNRLRVASVTAAEESERLGAASRAAAQRLSLNLACAKSKRAEAREAAVARASALAEVARTDASLKAARERVAAAGRTHDRAKREAEEFAALVATGACPTCRQRFVDKASLAAAKTKQDERLREAEREVFDAVKASKHEAVASASAREALPSNGHDQSAREAETAAEEASRAAQRASDRASDASSAAARASAAAEAAKSAVAGAAAEARERLVGLRAAADARRLELAGLGEADAAARARAEVEGAARRRAEFWVDGFGPRGLRSLIMENVLPFVSGRADYYAGRLTGGTIRVEISATTPTKGGEARERISVKAENSAGASAYEGNSGGERRRVDLAILLALQDLIAGRGGAAIKLAVYDEVFDQLDAEGVERAAEIIRETAAKKPVFVISHNDAVRGLFEDRIEMVKEAGVSRMEA